MKVRCYKILLNILVDHKIYTICISETQSNSQIDESCTATPTVQESVWINALERHHARLQAEETTPVPLVANEAEKSSKSASCPTSTATASASSITIFSR